jgi:transcriptional regulator with XRE-family HTH domain
LTPTVDKITQEPPEGDRTAEPERPEGDAPKPQPMLGRRLKSLRVSRGLSLKEVAAATGLSASFLSMVETGRNEITIGRLVTIADFYEVGLNDLIPDRAMEQPVVLRRDDRRTHASPDQQVTTEMLAAWHHGDMTSGFRRFEAGAELREVSRQAGPEFVLVLAGELTIEFADDTVVQLGEGDSVWFEASRRHRQVNTGDGEAHVITFKGVIPTDEV